VYTLDASGRFPPELPLHQTICYRCIPNQKEEFVRYVKQSVPYLTLAIGDGANDKNMITQADVGVAVKGKEGSEAARVSDYVLGEFKLLSFLTLYYGREWYRKNSQLIAYNFFKNWFHVSSVVVYGAFTYFSGVLIFDIYLY
jgi:phospholipid-transporting ATPase